MTTNFDSKELGVTGLKCNFGQIEEEFLSQLKGEKARKVYKEMSKNDPVVGAMLFAVDMLIRQVKWRVEGASNNGEDKKAADFLESCRNDMSSTWEDIISVVLSMLQYGFCWNEILYKRRLGENQDPTKNSKYNDGRIGWRNFPIRSQDSLYEWAFDETGGLQAFIQLDNNLKTRVIPVDKSLLFRTTSAKGNPEGESVLRTAFRPWAFKKRIENLEGIGIERDLAGLPMALVPPELLNKNASPEQKNILEEIKSIVRNVRRDEQEGLVFPLAYDENGREQYKFQLLSSGGQRQLDIDKTINRYDQRIAMTILADFILLGHQKTGSFALSSDKTHLFAVALGAWLSSIEAVFNRYAVPRLFKYNTFNVKELPKIKHGDIETVNLTELSDFVSKLSASGAITFPDDDLENYLRIQAKLPKKKEWEKGE